MKQALDAAGVKAVVSHQHRYGEHYKKVKSIIASGAIGQVHTVYGTATGWAAHMLSHLVDYTSWFNDYAPAEWVMAQAAGRGKLADLHTSPDYVAGVVHFANGVRGIYDCGAGAPDVPEASAWWRKCRIGAHGLGGYAEVQTGGGWRAVTKDGVASGPGNMDYDHDMPRLRPGNGRLARRRPARRIRARSTTRTTGSEIMSGMYRSVIEGGQIALPLTSGMDEIAGLKTRVPDRKVLMTLADSAKDTRSRQAGVLGMEPPVSLRRRSASTWFNDCLTSLVLVLLFTSPGLRPARGTTGRAGWVASQLHHHLHGRSGIRRSRELRSSDDSDAQPGSHGGRGPALDELLRRAGLHAVACAVDDRPVGHSNRAGARACCFRTRPAVSNRVRSRSPRS